MHKTGAAYFFVVFLLLNCWGYQAFAADDPQIRAKKSYFFGIKPIGFVGIANISRPVTAGININGAWQVGFEYGAGSTSGDLDVKNSYSLDLVDYGIYSRQFIADTFNWFAAVNYRSFSMDTTTVIFNSDSSGLLDESVSIKADATVLTAGLSNHWSYSNGFWFAFDWYALSGNLDQSYKFSIENQSLTTAQKKELENESERNGRFLNRLSANTGLVVLSLGYSF